MAKDYYNILGIDKKATKDDIKKRFANSHTNIIPTKRAVMRRNLRK